jgi:catechol-2,3-dioxygenase
LRQGPRPQFASFGYWLYIGPNAVLHLSETDAGEHRPPNTANTFDHVAFSCCGRAATVALLEQLRVPYRSSAVPDAAVQQLFLRDPAGNGVELNFAEPRDLS